MHPPIEKIPVFSLPEFCMKINESENLSPFLLSAGLSGKQKQE